MIAFSVLASSLLWLGGVGSTLEPVEPQTTQTTQSSEPEPSGFPDVPADAWAYEAVRSLVENYGCLAGYPDGTFQGDQPLTRYKFAAGINACMNALLEVIQAQQAAQQAGIDQLIQSMEEFQTELDELSGETVPDGD